ncbi:MAG: hypothetical protein HY819_14630 [Acidobacteria bacterium]|nr:hypothetical protein [Acidobacteriota bacterium]
MPSYSGTSLAALAEKLLMSKIYYQEDSFQEALYDLGSTSALSQAMAQNMDKKSKAYKAAMRKVNFYKRGLRKPSKKSQEQILAVLQQNPKTKSRYIQQVGQLRITIEGTWRKSRDVRRRRIVHTLSIESAKKFLTEIMKSESAGMDYFLMDYGVDDAIFENYSVTIDEI